jgi:site-specific DNA-adenine methylase
MKQTKRIRNASETIATTHSLTAATEVIIKLKNQRFVFFDPYTNHIATMQVRTMTDPL